MDSALGVFRGDEKALPEAGIARRAVLELSDQLKEVLLFSLGRVEDGPSPAERRRRQFALLAERPPADGQTAQDLADAFDAFERLPAR